MMEATAGATVQSWRPIMGRWRTLAKEISAFGVVGAINVAVDLPVPAAMADQRLPALGHIDDLEDPQHDQHVMTETVVSGGSA